MFELVLNDDNEIERIDVLRAEVNIHREENPPSEPPSDDESDNDGDGGDDSDSGDWETDSEPEGGLWYNGDDYVGDRFIGRRRRI